VERHVDQPDGAPCAGGAAAGAHAVFTPAVGRGNDGRVERRRTNPGPAIASIGLTPVIQSRRGALR
jgi:hypothetical protein